MATEHSFCSYVVREDTGLAPNPFWGHCTLAVCTPNHQGTRMALGGWICGFLNKTNGYRFLYAMEVDEVMDLDKYFHDPRFTQKKPNLRGSWQEQCGDNFYSRGREGQWVQHRNRFHLGEGMKEQDTRHARVFIGRRFWYRGRYAAPTPVEYLPLVGGRGARVTHDRILVERFKDWVVSTFEPGVADLPNHKREALNTLAE